MSREILGDRAKSALSISTVATMSPSSGWSPLKMGTTVPNPAAGNLDS